MHSRVIRELKSLLMEGCKIIFFDHPTVKLKLDEDKVLTDDVSLKKCKLKLTFVYHYAEMSFFLSRGKLCESYFSLKTFHLPKRKLVSNAN